jgi:dTMP kinase
MNTALKGKLIVIEGGDGAGKGTQAALLKTALEKLENQVTALDFPQYDTPMGALIGRALRGEFGDWSTIHPELAFPLYTIDRVAARERIITALGQGVVISNRYTQSNIAYQMAKFSEQAKALEFARFLETLEHDTLGIPRPDMVIYLKVPSAIGQALVAKKEARGYLGENATGALDCNEANRPYQQRVADMYTLLAGHYPYFRIIDCAPQGEILPREEIHARVMEQVLAVS